MHITLLATTLILQVAALLTDPPLRDLALHPSNPFTLTPAFTIVFQVGFPSPKIQPVDSSGSVGFVPVLGGIVFGPLLNGTITGGIEYDSRFATYYLDDDVNYGVTDDGEAFRFVHSGVGNAGGKVDRLVSLDLETLSMSFSKCPGAWYLSLGLLVYVDSEQPANKCNGAQTITIGGKYGYLSQSFLLQATETNVTLAGGTCRGEVFLVGSTLQAFP